MPLPTTRSDALNHSSIVEGVRGSGAKVQPFAHNNMAHLEAILQRATTKGQPGGVPWRKIIIMVRRAGKGREGRGPKEPCRVVPRCVARGRQRGGWRQGPTRGGAL